MPDKVFEDGMLIGGELPQGVATFLGQATSLGITVSFVIPVDPPPGQSEEQFLSDLKDFVSAASNQFPDTIRSWELGNEYWGGRTIGDASLEAAYGQAAAKATKAISAGLDLAGTDADIFLQASGNLRGAYDNDPRLANVAIQDAFASLNGAVDELDGVIRNFYWKDPAEGGFDNDTGAFREDRALSENLAGSGIGGWDEWLGREIDRMVGEYNINLNLSLGEDGIDLGVHGASMFLEHYTNLVEADVDTAFVWPMLHNTRNALLHKDEPLEVLELDGLSIATNTTRAAMFDLIRQTVADHELIDIEWTGPETPYSIEVTAWESRDDLDETTPGERVVYLSSRTDVAIETTIDLTLFTDGWLAVSGIRVGYEDSGGDQRNAIVSEIDLTELADGVGSLTLDAYEVVQLRFEEPLETPEIPDYVMQNGSDGADTIYGGEGPDRIEGGAGADLLVGREGSDILFGGTWSDTLSGGLGDDTLWGGDAGDLLGGGDGADLLIGGTGADTLQGGAGDDVIHGGTWSDWLEGNVGDDILHGEQGNDTLMGGFGDDILLGGDQADILSGGPGHDRIEGGAGSDALSGGLGHDSLFGGSGQDELNGSSGADWLEGGDGDDILTGGAGTDSLTGGRGADRFVFSEFDAGFDRVTDFEFGVDLLCFSSPGVTGLEDLRLISYENGASTLIRFVGDAGEIDWASGGIVLDGIADGSQLDASDFCFA
ncbi:calcium-binding protein [uncultured Jannaschia sp.]|uniref:calcium-binding protein n=1 Tax=uncultured Jannaschia sp. TaxID=293347 RepID=UPI002622465A|nr:calcium-binding protein [uncultured Jannaschia sp.]